MTARIIRSQPEPKLTITDDQLAAHVAVTEAFGRSGLVEESVTLVPAHEKTEDGKTQPVVVAVRHWRVGVSGDAVSWTVLGEGSTWQAALAEATAPTARRRPAYRKPVKGGL